MSPQIKNKTWQAWADEIADDEIIIDRHIINNEADGNCWKFTMSQELASDTKLEHVMAFASQVKQSRKNWLIEHGAQSMVMYWWHDEMSGQLCFSLVSLCHGKLPFGCKVILRHTKSLEDIVNEWFNSPYHPVRPNGRAGFLYGCHSSRLGRSQLFSSSVL